MAARTFNATKMFPEPRAETRLYTKRRSSMKVVCIQHVGTGTVAGVQCATFFRATLFQMGRMPVIGSFNQIMMRSTE